MLFGRRRRLTVVGDHGAGALDDLAGLALSVDLAEAGPLAQGLLLGHGDEVHAAGAGAGRGRRGCRPAGAESSAWPTSLHMLASPGIYLAAGAWGLACRHGAGRGASEGAPLRGCSSQNGQRVAPGGRPPPPLPPPPLPPLLAAAAALRAPLLGAQGLDQLLVVGLVAVVGQDGQL